MKQTIILSCLIFILFLVLLPTHILAMLGDPDTGWHLAAGDLIRSIGRVPDHDPFSFTAENQHWRNIAWGWDVAVSFLYQHFGWQGLIAFNSITIATTLVLIFAHCFIRAEHGISAFLVLFLIVMQFPLFIRPYQITFLLAAALFLLLSQIARRRVSPYWLISVPVMMALWVNVHGGFLVGFCLLGAYALQAIYEKNVHLAAWLVSTGIVSLLACLLNPYGIYIVTVTLNVLWSVANPMIDEWQPFNFAKSPYIDLYIFLFIFLVLMRPVIALKAEKALACIWLFLGLLSVRHLVLFFIMSAPLMAVGLRNVMIGKRAAAAVAPIIQRIMDWAFWLINRKTSVCTIVIIAVGLSAWMFTPQAMQLYAMSPPANSGALPDLSQEINFIETHLPKARLLTNFDFGGPLIFYTRGKIPVFVDGRTENIYSKELLRDYMAFRNGSKNWETLLERYHIDGVMLKSDEDEMLDRFAKRQGWHLAFKGKTATIFMRDSYSRPK